MKTLFVPIKSQNLAHYYRTGLILPANYFENRAEDIQSFFQDEIVLSKKKWTDETDCCLEIVLNKLNTNSVSQNLQTISKPIPISRIKAIFFTEKEQKETTLWNINNSSAFIPENIVKIENNPVEKINTQHELDNIPDNNNTQNIKEDIQKFDKILGGLAFMKLGGTSIMNYSQNYFVVLSDLNKNIENDLANANISFNYKLKGILTGSANGWQILLQHLQKEITKDYVLNLAQQKKIKLEEDYDILNFNNLDLSNTDARIIYFLSIIATYGKGKRKKAEDLYPDLLQDKIKYNKEIVALLFGMYEGYKTLIPSIKNKPVKFKLNSKLDFYIIESVYQYVFNGISENTNFEYIDNWCPKFENKINENDFVTYQILDKKIIVKKKIRPDSPEFLEQFYQKYIPQFFAEISNTEISKIIDIQELFESINIKYLLSKFQKTIISSIETKQSNKKSAIQQNSVKKEIKQHTKQYSETELKKLSLKELENILNNNNTDFRKSRTKKPYIKLILNLQQGASILFK